MKWEVGDCIFGDMIRVKLGTILHYGIYVSEGEVIQFGLPPVGREMLSGEGVTVCSTDIDGFSCGNFVEVAVPDKKEKKKRFSPEKTVQIAKSRLGEGGYNVLHNNCEHFANECYFGVHRCEQEEKLRQKWLSRPVLGVYVCPITDNCDIILTPPERQKEVEKVTNESLKRQKITTWTLLKTAIKHSFGYDFSELEFTREKGGKWVCDKLYFSLSHTSGHAVVAVSNAPVGVDAENAEAFEKRWKDESARRAFAEKIAAKGENVDLNDLISLWLKKESAYKLCGKGAFNPRNINTDQIDYVLRDLAGNRVAVCGKNIGSAKFFKVENQTVTPLV